jgi:hypothetical protein
MFTLHPEDGGSKVHYTASQPRRPRLVSLTPWELQISQRTFDKKEVRRIFRAVRVKARGG